MTTDAFDDPFACGTWLVVFRGTPSDFNDWLWSRGRSTGTAARMVRGAKMKDVGALLDEWSAALQFPYYFGGNWAAFDECLADLEWLWAERYLIGILEADLAALPEDDWTALLALLKRQAEEWGTAMSHRPARPFVVAAQVAESDSRFVQRCAELRIPTVEARPR